MKDEMYSSCTVLRKEEIKMMTVNSTGNGNGGVCMTDSENKFKEQVAGLYEEIRFSDEKKETAYEAILKRAELESAEKKEDSMKGFVKAAVVAGCILVGGGSVYAGVRLMHPVEVAKELEKPKLAEKFSGLSAHVETQENDTYIVNYLGEVSGKNLTEQAEGEVDKEKTYYVLTVEKKGEPITYDDSICATPFVKGYAPWQFNIFYMGGGAESKIVNHVRYYIFESDNIEIFADKGLYLGVCENAPDAEEYSFDEKTGEIFRKEDYKGLNMLFKLDIDKSKADTKKAEQYLKGLDMDSEADDDVDWIQDGGKKVEYYGDSSSDAYDWTNYFTELPNQLKKEFLKSSAVLIPDSVQTVKANADGEFVYTYERDGDTSTIREWKDYLRVGEINMTSEKVNDEPLWINTTVLNKDGTLTFAMYQVDEEALKSYRISPTKKVTEEYLKFMNLQGRKIMRYILEHGTVIPDSVKTVKADKNGRFVYSYHRDKNCFRKIDAQKEGFDVGVECYEGPAGETENGFVVITQRLNQDGSMTFQAYELDEKFVM